MIVQQGVPGISRKHHSFPVCPGVINIAPTLTKTRAFLIWGPPQQLSSLQARLLILSPERKATIFRDESWQCAALLRSTPSGSINETSQQFSSPVLTARPSINRSEPSHKFSQLLALSLPVAAPQLAANFNVGNWHRAPQRVRA